MKITILSFLLVSFSAFAQDLEATQALLSIFPTGHYQGSSPASGENCDVKISVTSFGLSISAFSQGNAAVRNIHKGSTYHWNPANRSFLSSEFFPIPGGRHENTFRTLAVENHTQYVVISDRQSTLECIVNL